MKAKKRTYNTRLLKRDFCYSIGEITELFKVHQNSVRNWIKSGLRLIDKMRPHLIHGTELIEFLKTRQAKRKRPCKPHEFYCFKCHVPRPLWKRNISIEILSPARVQLSGLCATCKTKVFKAGSIKKLPYYTKTFNVQEMQGQHIIERTHPSLMCHFERTKKS